MIAKRLGAALAGRSMWMKLKRKYDVDDGVYVLLMPEDDLELNEHALRHIDDLTAYRKARGVVILTDRAWVLENAGAYSDKILALDEVTEREIDNLLSFFELYAFTERLLVVSLTKPFGNKLHKTLGAQGVTKEDLVCLCIFLIRDWTETERGV
ncbi:MAG: hypothetical protein LBP30_02655 [Clostridiales Family XIII bacterium]|jgi:hypothetical protein|nr:hypothetical protein [Clostridiales Family XIII bacterium]